MNSSINLQTANFTMGTGLGAPKTAGKPCTGKSFLRLLLGIIGFNLIVALFYFTGSFSIQPPKRTRIEFEGTSPKKLQLAANTDFKQAGFKQIATDNFGRNKKNHKNQDGPFTIQPGNPDKEKGASTTKTDIDQHSVANRQKENVLKISDHDLTKDENVTEFIDRDLHYLGTDKNPNIKFTNFETGLGSDETSPVSSNVDENEDQEKEIRNPLFPIDYDQKQESGRKIDNLLGEEDHPQYNKAFPKHVMPLELLNWTRSNESHKYFQPVDDKEIWIYSAYFDNRGEDPLIRIFGITHRDLSRRVFCYFFGYQGGFIKLRKGLVKLLKDSHGSSFAAVQILCPDKKNMQPSFVKVSFTGKSSYLATNHMKVTYPGVQTRNFTVCFPPLHSNFSKVSQLIQTIELSRTFGANHFIVYNFSVSPEVNVVLRYYQGQRLLTVLPWPLPVLDTWYFGQVLAINDCIYRNQGLSKFVAISDTDEVIVPHIHLSWSKLLANVAKHPWQRDDQFNWDADYGGRVGVDFDTEDEMAGKKKRWDNEDDESDKSHDDDDQQKQKAVKKKKLFLPSSEFEGNVHHDDNTVRKARPNDISGNNIVVPKRGGRQDSKSDFIRADSKFPSRSRGGNPSSRHLLAYQSGVLGDETAAGDDQPRFGSFLFRCAFYTEKQPVTQKDKKELKSFSFTQEEKDLFNQMPSSPMVNLMRTDTIFEHTIRSKTIVKPELVVSSGIHHVVSHIEGYRTAYVQPEIALLHHYRVYKLDTCNTLDTSVLMFKDKFYRNLKVAVEDLSALTMS